MIPVENLGMVFYSHSIATITLSCIISEIKRDIPIILVENPDFFHITLAFDTPVRGNACRNTAITFGMEKLE